jgi:hypothetical protein
LARYNEEKIQFIFKAFYFAWRKRKIEVDKIVPIEEWKKLGIMLLKRF